MTTPRIEVRFTRRVRSAMGASGMANIEQSVQRYAAGLSRDIGLAAIEVADCGLSRSPARLEVTINSSPCRIPMRALARTALAPSATELSWQIARVVHVNRELLVDSHVAEAFREARAGGRSAPYLPGLSRKEFADFLRMLLHGSRRVDKGDSLDEATGSGLWSAQSTFEEAVRALRELQYVVWHPPGAEHTDEIDDEPIERIFDSQQEDLFGELGIRFPRAELREDSNLMEDEFRIQINDLRLPLEAGLRSSNFLVSGTREEMRRLRIRARPALNPETGAPAAFGEGGARAAKRAREAGYQTWGRAAYMALAGGAELRRHVAAFITVESVQYDLNRLKNRYPDLITAAAERFGVSMIVQVLRSLTQEGICVLNLPGIMEAMLAIGSTTDADFSNVVPPYVVALCPAVFGKQIQEVDWSGYAECIRTRFRDYISHKYSGGKSTLSVYLLDPAIESRLARAHSDPLPELERVAILGALDARIGNIPTNRKPAILTGIEARKRFKELIEVEFPEVAVLAYQELSPHLRIQPLGDIAVQQHAA